MLQFFLSYEFFFWGGCCISRSGMARLRSITFLWLLIFLVKLFSKRFCSSYVPCSCYFLIYIQYVEIYFSPNYIICLCNCGRQNSKMLLKIHHFLSPSIHALSNPWDCKLDSFHSHDQYVKWHNSHSEREIFRVGLILRSSYNYISLLKVQFSLTGSSERSQKN